jgi:hypothetical protein
VVVAKTKTPRIREVRRALPTEPEVRRAEPAPPEEGPVNSSTNRAVPSEAQTNSIAPNAPTENPDDEAIVTESRPVKKAETQPQFSTKPRVKKSESVTKKKDSDREVFVSQTAPDPDAGMPKLPRGSVRARFVGVTADGRWMLALPSRKVIVVPPPPDDGR